MTRPRSHLVKLTPHEQFLAHTVGHQRQLSALLHKRPEPYGAPDADPWENHAHAAGAEIAVARHLDRFWTPLAERPSELPGDIGNGIQVRYTKHERGRLILHERDRDEHWFVLVRGTFPEFSIVGGIQGRGGKRREWWTDPGTGRPAFFVPDDALVTVRPQRVVVAEAAEGRAAA